MKAQTMTLALVVGFSAILAGAPSDTVSGKYEKELSDLRREHQKEVDEIRRRMAQDYKREIESPWSAKDPDKVKTMKSTAEAIEDRMTPAKAIIGTWAIVQSNKTTSFWRFNRDGTYNYGHDTGKWSYSGGKFVMEHTWDWALELQAEDLFEGVCTRGAKCSVRGMRIPDGFLSSDPFQ